MRRLLFLTLGLIGCSDLDVLTAEFSDELVEAQARTVELKVVDNTDCATLLRIEHDQIESVANVVAVRTTSYPIDPASGILRDLPRDRPLVFDVSVLNQDARQVGRACQGVTLPGDGMTEVTMTMLALPMCETSPTGLDIVVVLDASLDMRNADINIGGELVDRLLPFFDAGFSPGGDRWTLITHGPTEEPTIAVPATDDRDAIAAAIEAAAQNFGGPSQLYDAVRLGTVLARSRAVCGRQPALLVIAGGPDNGLAGGRELAVAGLAGDRRDPKDDLYATGIAISAFAKPALDLVIIDDFGPTQAALTAESLSSALRRTRERLQGLVGL